jgi:hypothetical protein
MPSITAADNVRFESKRLFSFSVGTVPFGTCWVGKQSRWPDGRCSKTHQLRTKCGGMTRISVAALIATLATPIDLKGHEA